MLRLLPWQRLVTFGYLTRESALSQPTEQDVSALLEALGRGRASAAEQLLPLVYDELRALAASYLASQRRAHTLAPTALVHEAYLKLAGSQGDNWQGRGHFFAVAARAMRQVLVSYARERGAKKRGGDAHRITLVDVASSSAGSEFDLEALDAALTELQRIDPLQSQIVELRFLAGLTVDETAEVLNISARAVDLEWRMAKARLKVFLREVAT